MQTTLSGNQRWWVYSLLGLLVLAVAGLVMSASVLIARYRDAADYPGALRLSEGNLYKFWPRLIIRRDTSYQTSAPYDEVYNYYSHGFQLGPEQHALGVCSTIAASTTTAGFIETDMAVTLCDTPTGRMIFVMRAVSLHRP